MFRKGFTLIELSIVLVIIGLIVAGIVGGQELVRQAELRSVISDVNKYELAVNTFKLKYDALPGDFTEASKYWPNCDPTPVNCDGNNNGKIGADGIVAGDPIHADQQENYRAWQHLSLSGVLEGNYTGESSNIAGQTVPKSSISSIVFGIITDSGAWRTSFLDTEPGLGHSLVFAKIRSSDNKIAEPALNAEDSYNLDKKIDDGKPGSGKVYGYSCLEGTYPDLSYDLDSSSLCMLWFSIQ